MFLPSSEEEALKYDGFIGGRKKEKKKKVLAQGPAGAAGATAGGKRNVKFGTDSRKEFEKDEPVTQVKCLNNISIFVPRLCTKVGYSRCPPMYGKCRLLSIDRNLDYKGESDVI